ncbi:pyruvate, water dikinase regulatory protein [Pararhizobium sp. IMCC21322]|uniref:pyruvate, water dikinase regulatory protein n=1 Tax=Pararhizobium sp. IMCC21322 TaxID=3067903 RepID=UPI00274297EA|nr:pyruvate, water dikinase regulatory protein [Pararhizobium sp. IMCC21322]
MKKSTFFHLHLISDATGETLINVGRAAAAQYDSAQAREHIYTMVRSEKDIAQVVEDIEASPGIVLYTLIEPDHAALLEERCRELGVPALSVLDPILSLFQTYLGAKSAQRAGAQHALDTEYFRRIDALNFTLSHDDGQMSDDLEEADVVILGISRTSKTPTSIYLANRGVKAANIPLVPDVPLPDVIEKMTDAFIVGLIASPDRIVQIRQHRLLSINAESKDTTYIDKHAVAEEIAQTRRLCARRGWPIIDVTRRSIEETAAAILTLYGAHKARQDNP